MTQSKGNIRQIKQGLIKYLSLQFLPLLIIGWSGSALDLLPPTIPDLISLAATILFIYGYIKCWSLALEYAKYKGYSEVFGILGMLSIFGLAILFMLKNKQFNNNIAFAEYPIKNFSIAAIFISYIIIDLLFASIIFIGAILFWGFEFKAAGELFNNKDFITAYSVPVGMIIVWYFFQEMDRAGVNVRQITGSFKRIDLKG